MSDKPLLFSGAMVRALLGGRKTQTRRALKLRGFKEFNNFSRSTTVGYDWQFRRDGCWNDLTHEELLARLPLAVGDRIWVKETWQALHKYNSVKPSEIPQGEPILYVADRPDMLWDAPQRPSIFMPRWASRLTLKVTDVRVERLQDISQSDAIEEGCHGPISPETAWETGLTPKAAYRELWNSINGPTAWDENPWVVAVAFGVEERNIDQPSQNGG